MQLHDFALALVAFASEFVGTLSGFGSSMFFVPTALFFESAQFVLALTGILHCFGNISKIVLFRKHFEWHIFLLLSIPFVIFTAAGALLVVYLGAGKIQPALGVLLIGYGLFSLLRSKKPRRIPKWATVCLSALSGLSTGFVGTGGAIRGVALATLHLPKSSFVGVSSAIDLGGDLVRTAIYLDNGFMNWSQWFYIPALAVSAYAGARVGQVFLNRINQKQFEKVVAAFILISGVLMLF